MKSIIIGLSTRGAYGYENEWFENGHVKVQRNNRDVGINKILSTPGTRVYLQVDGVVSAEYRVVDWNSLAWLVTPRYPLEEPGPDGDAEEFVQHIQIGRSQSGGAEVDDLDNDDRGRIRSSY